MKSKETICKEISQILQANFILYRRMPNRDYAPTEAILVENNERVSKLLHENLSLFEADQNFMESAKSFIEHSKSYRIFTESLRQSEHDKRFPRGFMKLVESYGGASCPK